MIPTRIVLPPQILGETQRVLCGRNIFGTTSPQNISRARDGIFQRRLSPSWQTTRAEGNGSSYSSPTPMPQRGKSKPAKNTRRQSSMFRQGRVNPGGTKILPAVRLRSRQTSGSICGQRCRFPCEPVGGQGERGCPATCGGRGGDPEATARLPGNCSTGPQAVVAQWTLPLLAGHLGRGDFRAWRIYVGPCDAWAPPAGQKILGRPPGPYFPGPADTNIAPGCVRTRFSARATLPAGGKMPEKYGARASGRSIIRASACTAVAGCRGAEAGGPQLIANRLRRVLRLRPGVRIRGNINPALGLKGRQ